MTNCNREREREKMSTLTLLAVLTLIRIGIQLDRNSIDRGVRTRTVKRGGLSYSVVSSIDLDEFERIE
jgi:hypothetical protein